MSVLRTYNVRRLCDLQATITLVSLPEAKERYPDALLQLFRVHQFNFVNSKSQFDLEMRRYETKSQQSLEAHCVSRSLTHHLRLIGTCNSTGLAWACVLERPMGNVLQRYDLIPHLRHPKLNLDCRSPALSRVSGYCEKNEPR